MSTHSTSASASTNTKVQNPNLCASCERNINFPCEKFQWFDCVRCRDQFYKCEVCNGWGCWLTPGNVPGNEQYFICGNCGGRGRLRGCPWCKGEGSLTVIGRNDQAIECEDCGGEGVRSCSCNKAFQVLRYLGLCAGDLHRAHPKPATNPRSRSLKEDWGKVVYPYGYKPQQAMREEARGVSSHNGADTTQ